MRAKVIGEGGNLGLTQRGRVEYALAGGRLCTDFIDNSAGVDCSDHEVNIKILLGAAAADGALTRAERDELLDADDRRGRRPRAARQLRPGHDPGRVAGPGARSRCPVHRRMIAEMERAGQLDRRLEALPTDDELDTRDGTGLTSPELAVLLAYAKIITSRSILESAAARRGLDGAGADRATSRPRCGNGSPSGCRALRLRREIVTTELVNEVVNRGGVSFMFRAVEETGASPDDVLRAYVVVRDVFDLPAFWAAVEALDGQVATDVQTAVYLEIRRLVDRAVRWLVSNRRTPIDVPAEIARLRPGVAALLPRLPELFRGRELASLQQHAETLEGHGLPADVAGWATRLRYGFGLLDVVEVARTTGRDLDEVAAVYFLLSERFRVDDLLSKISALPREDRWQTLARMALRYDLYAALAALTAEVLAAAGPELSAEEQVHEWESANASGIGRTRKAIGEFDESRADLATLSVLLRQIRTLVRASAAR